MKRGGATGRRYPIGAEIVPGEGVDFRVWAPSRSRVDLVVDGDAEQRPLTSDGDGYFRGFAGGLAAGARYRFRLDGDRSFPDPASRFQPDGPHGPSQVVDPFQFRWSDAAWEGVQPAGQVIYELHIGTFTREGTWQSAGRELPELARLGVTVLEVMPIADFPGRFGWGYDGVNHFAPTRLYGAPDDLRRFVDHAHALGIGVILDVVYNHFGPDGNYLGEFSSSYTTDRYQTDWGPAVNYDGSGAQGVRDLVAANARYWIAEYHFDGLRLDATQNIYDASEDHVLSVVQRAVRAAAGDRAAFIIAENEEQDSRLVRPAASGGHGLDAMWNDDFHHTARVALTGKTEAYYTDYGGSPQELISSSRRGFLYQGQHYAWQGKARGSPALDLLPRNFVAFLENHDQVANSAAGERLARLSNPACHRALVAFMLLGPQTPLLFQGEEFGSSRPFVYFADHGGELGELVRAGRREFLSQFPSMSGEVLARVRDPSDLATFEACKLDLSERQAHAELYALYGDLLALRKADAGLGQGADRAMWEGAVLSAQAFVMRVTQEDPALHRILLVNLGSDLVLHRAPEPLLAPPTRAGWRRRLSSDDVRYGGGGAGELWREGVLHVPGQATVLLEPEVQK